MGPARAPILARFRDTRVRCRNNGCGVAAKRWRAAFRRACWRYLWATVFLSGVLAAPAWKPTIAGFRETGLDAWRLSGRYRLKLPIPPGLGFCYRSPPRGLPIGLQLLALPACSVSHIEFAFPARAQGQTANVAGGLHSARPPELESPAPESGANAANSRRRCGRGMSVE